SRPSSSTPSSRTLSHLLGHGGSTRLSNCATHSTTVTYLESSKQFLQIRKVAARNGVEMLEGQNDVSEFNAEFLVVGKRKPKSARLREALPVAGEVPVNAGRSQRGSQEAATEAEFYVEKCQPISRDIGRDAEIIKGWATWGRWSVCSQECDGGNQVRSRACQPEEDVCQGIVEEGRACNPQPCIGKERNRSQGLRAIVGLKRDNTDDSNQGVVATQTDSKTDAWSPWSTCSITCGEGWQSRTRVCATTPSPPSAPDPCERTDPATTQPSAPLMVLGRSGPPGACALPHAAVDIVSVPACKMPLNGGEPCRGPTRQTKFCNIAVCPVDGSWNDWSGWMPRQLERVTNCFLKDCPVDGRWHAWTSWAAAARRVVEESSRDRESVKGLSLVESLAPVKRESRSVARKRCPEPHEICPEENTGDFVWRKPPPETWLPLPALLTPQV
ncbi:hypothetical protein KUCAC02_010771, partial [Chaenocephalus aceratus]